jgi:aminopeptidase N
MDLLNANSYQKGGWFLHMLRSDVGDKTFQKIIQTYYNLYKGSNADTRDFQKVAEHVSGKDLKQFFDQWLYQPGLPQLTIMEKLVGNELTFEITQGDQIFNFPLEIRVVAADDEVKTHRFDINKKTQTFTVNTKGPARVSINPELKVLYIEK